MVQKTNELKQYTITMIVVMLLFTNSGQTAQASLSQTTVSGEQPTAENLSTATSFQLIRFQDGVIEGEAAAFAEALGYELVAWIAPLHTAKVKVKAIQAATADASSLSTALSAIKFIELDSQVHSTGQDPALAESTQSYGLHNISAPEGWAQETGSISTIIAVIDTGLDMDNPEFSGRIVQGYDFINYDNDPDDDNGHGTHVTGIAAAAYGNSIGSAGVCSDCGIMPIKVLDENNAGDWFAVAQGIVYATTHGADIINLSLGSLQSSSVVELAVQYAQENGLLIVAAAGNAGSDMAFYPAALEGVIAVSAVRMNNAQWSLSNRGEHISVAAPGENIYSTMLNGTGTNSLSSRSGTSMASPYVAGLAGLLLSQNPNQSADGLTNIIIRSATDLGDSGFDEQFGHGLINVFAALNYSEAAEPILAMSQQSIALVYLPITAQN